MGCSSCGSGKDGMPRGCRNNGTCSSGGCSKLSVFDWLANIELPDAAAMFDKVEIRFKNSRKSFFINSRGINLSVGDIVVVEAKQGYDIGVVSTVGELARLQLQKKSPNFNNQSAKKILKHAAQEEIDKWVSYTKMEDQTMYRARKIAVALNLKMKISDVEYQGDGTKATFFYTADERVDFRILIKELISAFKIRVEMKQIGARQETAQIGGIGSCGRELCCSTWLTDFRSVSTKAARYQQLSLNPQKLAGQCGKLKCCLNFELDAYVETLKDFPSTEIKLKTKTGTAIHIKTDVFKRLMWYLHNTEEQSSPTLVALTTQEAKEIIEMNKKNVFPDNLKEEENKDRINEKTDYYEVVGQDDLNRFDDTFKKKRKKKRKPKNKIQDKQ